MAMISRQNEHYPLLMPPHRRNIQIMAEKQFAMGDRVRLVSLPPYVKTADPMPMLRPPNVLTVGEEGQILQRNPGNSWSVRFSSGAFLLDDQYLELVVGQPDAPYPAE